MKKENQKNNWKNNFFPKKNWKKKIEKIFFWKNEKKLKNIMRENALFFTKKI